MAAFAVVEAVEVYRVRDGLERVSLADGAEAYALTALAGSVQRGDELLVNTTAVRLGLGTGGAHVVHANLTRPHRGSGLGPGRVLKARYLSEQTEADVVEERGGRSDAAAPEASASPQQPSHSGGTHPQRPAAPGHPGRSEGSEDSGDSGDSGALVSDRPLGELLRGTRVVLCGLHSHAIALAAAVWAADRQAPAGLVCTDGAALPFVLSDLADAAAAVGAIADAVTCGQAFGAPVEAVTVASGVAALSERGIDRLIVAPLFGHVGTSSTLGFSSLELVGHAWVLGRLGAQCALTVRASNADARRRHRGVSHHTRTLVELCPPATAVPVPVAAGCRSSPDRRIDTRHVVAAAAHAGSAAAPAADAAEAAADIAAAPAADAAVEQLNAWAAEIGQRAWRCEPLDVAAALEACDLEVESMGRRLADDALACACIGAAAAWLTAKDG